jgi:ParB-like chromosome segregation protein Spo0J
MEIAKETLASKKNLQLFFQRVCKEDRMSLFDSLRSCTVKELEKACKTLSILGMSKKSKAIMAEKITEVITNGKDKTSKTKAKDKSNGTRTETDNSDMEEPNAPSSSGDDPKWDSPSFGKIRIKIDPEIKNKIPEPSAKQFQLVKKAIEKYGLRNKKFTILEDGTLVDGHTRYRIIQELQLDVPDIEFEVIEKKDIDQVITSLNVARRHLSAIEKIALVQPLLDELKEQTGQTPGRNTIAKIADVSSAAAQRVTFLQRYDPERLEEVRENPEGETLDQAWKDVYQKRQFVKENTPDQFEMVENNQLTVKEAYEFAKDELAERQKNKPPKRSKTYKALEKLRNFAESKINKYNNNQLRFGDGPDGRALQEIFNKIESMMEDEEG